MKRALLFMCLSVLFPLGAYGMTSETFEIQADAIGVGGGSGTSGSYGLVDTIGEPIIGKSQSETYGIEAGFAAMVNYSISLTVDSATANLGSVAPGDAANGQSILTVTTDSWGGYDLLIAENHPLLHTDAATTIADYGCTIAAPCAWSGNGFGFNVASGTGVNPKWGSNPNFNYAAIPTVATVFHSKTGYTSGGDQTSVKYYVSPGTTQKEGSYSNIITYTALAKL